MCNRQMPFILNINIFYIFSKYMCVTRALMKLYIIWLFIKFQYIFKEPEIYHGMEIVIWYIKHKHCLFWHIFPAKWKKKLNWFDAMWSQDCDPRLLRGVTRLTSLFSNVARAVVISCGLLHSVSMYICVSNTAVSQC